MLHVESKKSNIDSNETRYNWEYLAGVYDDRSNRMVDCCKTSFLTSFQDDDELTENEVIEEKNFLKNKEEAGSVKNKKNPESSLTSSVFTNNDVSKSVVPEKIRDPTEVVKKEDRIDINDAKKMTKVSKLSKCRVKQNHGVRDKENIQLIHFFDSGGIVNDHTSYSPSHRKQNSKCDTKGKHPSDSGKTHRIVSRHTRRVQKHHSVQQPKRIVRKNDLSIKQLQKTKGGRKTHLR